MWSSTWLQPGTSARPFDVGVHDPVSRKPHGDLPDRQKSSHWPSQDNYEGTNI